MEVPVFFIKPSGRVRRSLRRYSNTEGRPCVADASLAYCNAGVFRDYVVSTSDENVSRSLKKEAALQFSSDWPTKCDRCGAQFTDADAWQIFCEEEYADDRGNTYSLRDLPVGACYDAGWRSKYRSGSDGRSLYVMTPGGLWGIDERARNCTMPEDHVHRCWVRHGRPEDGTLHVDKNGPTCQAGAGSIQCNQYHGFLHEGKLTDCPDDCRVRR